MPVVAASDLGVLWFAGTATDVTHLLQSTIDLVSRCLLAIELDSCVLSGKTHRRRNDPGHPPIVAHRVLPRRRGTPPPIGLCASAFNAVLTVFGIHHSAINASRLIARQVIVSDDAALRSSLADRRMTTRRLRLPPPTDSR